MLHGPGLQRQELESRYKNVIFENTLDSFQILAKQSYHLAKSNPELRTQVKVFILFSFLKTFI